MFAIIARLSGICSRLRFNLFHIIPHYSISSPYDCISIWCHDEFVMFNVKILMWSYSLNARNLSRWTHSSFELGALQMFWAQSLVIYPRASLYEPMVMISNGHSPFWFKDIPEDWILRTDLSDQHWFKTIVTIHSVLPNASHTKGWHKKSILRMPFLFYGIRSFSTLWFDSSLIKLHRLLKKSFKRTPSRKEKNEIKRVDSTH